MSSGVLTRSPELHPAGAVKVRSNVHVPPGARAAPSQVSFETAKSGSQQPALLSVSDAAVPLFVTVNVVLQIAERRRVVVDVYPA